MIISLPAALIVAQVAMTGVTTVAADEPPRLDVDSTCRSAASVNPTDSAGSQGCLRSENEARADLRQRWGSFNAESKRQCTLQSSAGGFPSYVELLTCLELASGTVATRPPPGAATNGGDRPATTGTTGNAKGGPGNRNEGSELTREPAASQRTDPIKVLGKPAE